MATSDENNPGLVRPPNLRGPSKTGGRKFSPKKRQRKPLGEINGNTVARRGLFPVKNAVRGENEQDLVHQPSTRNFNEQIASALQPCTREGKKVKLTVSNSSASENCITDLGEYKDAPDVPVAGFLAHAEARIHGMDQMPLSPQAGSTEFTLQRQPCVCSTDVEMEDAVEEPVMDFDVVMEDRIEETIMDIDGPSSYYREVEGDNPHLKPHEVKNDGAIPEISDEDLNISEDLKDRSQIGKTFGEEVPLEMIEAEMKRNWYGVKAKVTFTPMGNDFYLVQFMNEADYKFVWQERPWFVKHRVFVLEKWVPDFNPLTAQVTHSPLWIRIPNVPIEMRVEGCLQKFLMHIGTVRKIDKYSHSLGKCVFARVLVDVDLRKRLSQVVRYKRKGTTHTMYITYEDIKEDCFLCGNPDHAFTCGEHSRGDYDRSSARGRCSRGELFRGDSDRSPAKGRFGRGQHSRGDSDQLPTRSRFVNGQHSRGDSDRSPTKDRSGRGQHSRGDSDRSPARGRFGRGQHSYRSPTKGRSSRGQHSRSDSDRSPVRGRSGRGQHSRGDSDRSPARGRSGRGQHSRGDSDRSPARGRSGHRQHSRGDSDRSPARGKYDRGQYSRGDFDRWPANRLPQGRGQIQRSDKVQSVGLADAKHDINQKDFSKDKSSSPARVHSEYRAIITKAQNVQATQKSEIRNQKSDIGDSDSVQLKGSSKSEEDRAREFTFPDFSFKRAEVVTQTRSKDKVATSGKGKRIPGKIDSMDSDFSANGEKEIRGRHNGRIKRIWK